MLRRSAGLLAGGLALAALAYVAWHQGALAPTATDVVEAPAIAVPGGRSDQGDGTAERRGVASRDTGPVPTTGGRRDRAPAAPVPRPGPDGNALVVAPRIASPAATPLPSPSGLVVPVAGISAAQLSDTFADVRGGERMHEAIDIMAPAGTPVLAVADGHVEKLFDSERGGLTIYQFEPSGRYCYYYAHLQNYAPGLEQGQAVKRGQVIGYVGATGNADTDAPHLHFAVFLLGPERQWWRGTPVNPYPLLGGR